MIDKFYSTKKKPGSKWDVRKKAWFTWGFNIRRLDGKRIQETGFFSQQDAESAVARIRLAEKEARYGFINSLQRQPRLKTLVERRLFVIPNRRERVRAQRVFGVLMEVISPNAEIPDITTADLQRYTDRRLADGLKPQSVGREWNIIAAMFNSAREHFPQMIDWVAPRFPRPKGAKKQKRERIITPVEIVKPLTWFYEPRRESETPEAWWNRRTVGHEFQFSLLTSARKGSLCVLQWPDVDFEARTAKITNVKSLEVNSKPERIVPLTDAALMILRERKEHWHHPFVFTRKGGEITDYYKIWKECAKSTGINYGQNIEGGFRPHDARHTAATMFYRQTKDLTIVRAFTGHDSDELFVYLHEDEDTMREAANAMEGYIKSGTEG